GVGVDHNQDGDFAGDPGFFLGLAHSRVGDGFAEVHAAAGDGPVAVVCAPDQQDLALAVDGNHVGGRDHAVGLGRGRVVEVVDPLSHGHIPFCPVQVLRVWSHT